MHRTMHYIRTGRKNVAPFSNKIKLSRDRMSLFQFDFTICFTNELAAYSRISTASNTHTHTNKHTKCIHEEVEGKFLAIFNLQVEHNLILLLCAWLSFVVEWWWSRTDFEFYSLWLRLVCTVCLFNKCLHCVCQQIPVLFRTWTIAVRHGVSSISIVSFFLVRYEKIVLLFFHLANKKML